MTELAYATGADALRVLEQVRETFESRDYLWQSDEAGGRATASEDGRPVHNVATAQRLRVAVAVYADKNCVVLTNETVGAAYGANGGPWVGLQLAARFRRVVRAVARDLEAAGLR
jgi:hypothetical protein